MQPNPGSASELIWASLYCCTTSELHGIILCLIHYIWIHLNWYEPHLITAELCTTSELHWAILNLNASELIWASLYCCNAVHYIWASQHLSFATSELHFILLCLIHYIWASLYCCNAVHMIASVLIRDALKLQPTPLHFIALTHRDKMPCYTTAREWIWNFKLPHCTANLQLGALPPVRDYGLT